MIQAEGTVPDIAGGAAKFMWALGCGFRPAAHFAPFGINRAVIFLSQTPLKPVVGMEVLLF